MLLRGPVISAIRFRFPIGPLPGNEEAVVSTSYHRVADAIDSGAVRLKEATSFPPGIAGEYTSNTLRLSPVRDPASRALAVHECTHAFFDIARKRISDQNDEAAAYAAGMLYLVLCGLGGSPVSGPYDAARPVAEGLLQAYRAGTAGAPMVDLAAWQALRTYIRAHPSYRHLRGRWPDDTRGYPHDG
ncbi:hypothetical protein [Reyranella sp. CPCC 100927]|uniref:hypothetical protein n=1 Tax=Reyranella sp. CPCC 100927 TaxID=2599616 RepID=UPI0011B6E15E|nr:hypothetical protein [Reyranella sp. CPCC 100927]TWT01685.1 hypothetical protein FQU96_31870 [Reyranella sp. CPCC 100927]